ncbi:MAG: DNRLRE domain-containing protein [Planctomycetes bacterium]|nr:DNRLRE domain-containing protein [Planctomycetota bacterium]
MMRTMHRSATLAVAVLGLAATASAGPVNLAAVADNTLYAGATDVSNGAGDYFFAGSNGGGDPRRGLITFDVAAVLPAGSTITGVTLTLSMSRTLQPTGQGVNLHRLTNSWGEGVSDAGGEEGGGAAALDDDATWPYRFYDEAAPASSTPWGTDGGDFVAAPSATSTISGIGFYSWSSPQMIADVQAWLDDPASCHGWLLAGNEATSFTAKRFDTRTHPITARRPVLSVTFAAAACPADLDGSGDVGFGDILQIIGAWGPCGVPCDEDLSGNGAVDFADILVVIAAWGPC